MAKICDVDDTNLSVKSLCLTTD